MPNVVVFCRRWIHWSQFPQELHTATEQAEFRRAFQIERLQAEWQRDNPGIPLSRYRQELQALARRSWEASGAEVVLHHCPADAPHLPEPQAALIQRVRSARWVIPIDDDDWLAPHLLNHLEQPRGQRAWMASWPSWLIYLHTHHIQTPPPITVLPETVHQKVPVLVSCSAAISSQLIQQLSDQELWLVLMQHGETSRWHAELPSGLRLQLTDGLAVHLRHQGTAGSGQQNNLNRQLGNFLQRSDLNHLPGWIQTYLTSLASAHTKG
jgi:hypothetical protein